MKLNYKELLLFAGAGVLGYLADVATTLLLEGLLGVYAARIPAFVAAVTVTWIYNRNITFKSSESKHESLITEYFHYAGLMVFGLIVNYIVYAIAISVMPDSKYSIILSVALGSLAGMIVNYVNSKKFIFKKNSK